MNVSKAELSNRISKRTGIEKSTVLKVLESFFEDVPQILNNGRDIQIRGFGTFKNVERAEKVARNISKGTSIRIPAHTEKVFKFSKEVK